jgi:16S rRNA (cytidine1402-2'-O)-methyltransferase
MPTLYNVATPIGNLEDISARASKTLSTCDIVLAEDTRTSSKLIGRLGLSIKLIPYHDFNKEKMAPWALEQLKAGKNIALITDAGTPGIADPAFNLVRSAIDNAIAVIPIPGPCAAIAALVCSGLPTDRFIFENFLPAKSKRRKEILAELAKETRTIILYESPYRIKDTLEDMCEIIPDVLVVVAREMTKIYEEFLRDTPAALLAHFEKNQPRGEITVLFNPRIRAKKSDESGG